MLQQIRERLTGILAFVIIGILVIPFAFVGVNSYFSAGNANLVALVNDQEISFNDFNQSFLDFRRRAMAQMGAAFDATEFESDIARMEHLDSMIDQVLLRQAALELNFAVDDNALAEQIRSFPTFQIDGVFSAEVYQARLLATGQTPQQFENQLRNDIAVNQLPAGISGSSFATDREVAEFIALAEQTRSFSALVVDAAAQELVGEFSEQEIADWYEQNSSRFQLPERVSIEYLELAPETIVSDEDPGDEYLRARFEAQQQRFISPEQRRVSHILFEVGPDAEPADIATARLQAEAVYQQLREGADFAALAAEFSDDIGSAGQGGDLGFIQPGSMVEGFENAAYALSLAEPVSEPVQTGFGWHVIKLTDLRASSGQTFEQARDTLLDEYREEQVERQFLELADRMVDIVYEDPTTLEAASLDLGLDIQVAGPFSREGGEGIASNPEIVAEAFSDLVLEQGSVSDPVDMGVNHMVMLRVTEQLPVATQPLEEVREQVLEGLRNERALAAARAQADALKASAESLGSLAQAAETAGLLVVEVNAAARNALQPDATVVSNVFRLPAPQPDQASLHVVEADNGYAVVELAAVTPGSIEDGGLIAARQARMILANSSAGFETYALVRQLREQADVQVFEQNLRTAR
jgi:peptidyl-prolyl cis-trans isomerase D